MSDIIDLLVDDHRAILELVTRLITDPRGAEVDKSFDRLYACLKAHTFYEETSVYPLLARKVECKELALHAYEHHRQANRLLDALRESDLKDASRKAKLMVLNEDLALHFKLEESSLLPLLGTSVSPEIMASLGETYRGIRDKLQIKMTQMALPEPSHLAPAT